ncbi:Glycerol-3-phosphate acyltransferase [Geodia barretti]|uniref:Glycerol-3-phosphate acyltransferase n=1 Tax=Geodia barretti TaxID=519541 RepID=A0AA35W8X8_GEOBA|nr:Glycerol-3-phosphate acyltransferase [Geodia barretti]
MAAPIILTLLSYLLGSIPAGFLVGSSAGVDVRSAGSGNIGATNVARTLGWKKGLVTLFADVAKGFLPVLAAHLLDLGNAAAAAAGLAAFAGHLYPVFLRFKGGKGVATAAGVYLAAMPLGILVVVGVFVLVMLAARRVSLASLSAAVLAPVVAWALSYPEEVAWMSLVIGILVVLRHRDNIRRLMAGEEPRFNLRR